MTEQMQKCENCLRDFPQSKIATHYGYCRRNIKKCHECGEMYDINSQQEHEEEFHKKAKCQYCKSEFKVQDLDGHKLNCTKKTKFCEYCELNVPINEYNFHLRGCEARTKPCDKCNKPITNKDYLIHIVSCTGPQEVVAPPSSYDNYLKKQRQRQQEMKGVKQRQLKGYEQFIKNERVQPNGYRHVEQKKKQEIYQKQIKPKIQYSHQIKNQSSHGGNGVPTRASSSSRGGIGVTNPLKKQVKQDFGYQYSKQVKNVNNLNNKPNQISNKVEKKIETKKLVPSSGFDKKQLPNFQRRESQKYEKKQTQDSKPSYGNNLRQNQRVQVSRQSTNKNTVKNEVPKKEVKAFDPRQYGGYDADIPQEALEYQDNSNRNFNGHNLEIDEDEQIQKAIMQSLEGQKKKMANMKNLPKELQGADLMEKSFYRDIDEKKQLELYEQIQRNARKNKR